MTLFQDDCNIGQSRPRTYRNTKTPGGDFVGVYRGKRVKKGRKRKGEMREKGKCTCLIKFEVSTSRSFGM